MENVIVLWQDSQSCDTGGWLGGCDVAPHGLPPKWQDTHSPGTTSWSSVTAVKLRSKKGVWQLSQVSGAGM